MTIPKTPVTRTNAVPGLGKGQRTSAGSQLEQTVEKKDVGECEWLGRRQLKFKDGRKEGFRVENKRRMVSKKDVDKENCW